MIQPGFHASQNGRKITANSSEESKWLKSILDAIDNGSSISSAISTALGSGSTYNTIDHFNLLSADTHTFITDTLHSLSFSVIKGTVAVTIDAGLITYPSGSNVNIEATKTIQGDIIFTVSGSNGDGNNQVIIQTSKE